MFKFKFSGLTGQEARTHHLGQIRLDWENIQNVDPDEMTAEMACLAVRLNGQAIQYVPDRLITRNMCDDALEEDGTLIKYVPKDLKTPGRCARAVIQDVRALEFIPEEVKTKTFFEYVAKENGYVINYVPQEMITDQIIAEAVGANPEIVAGFKVDFVSRIPQEALSKLVKKTPGTIQYLPAEIITKEIALMAVKRDPSCIVYIPESLRKDKAFYEEAALSNGKILVFIPEDCKTEKVCLNALFSSDEILDSVPKKYLTKKNWHKIVSFDDLSSITGVSAIPVEYIDGDFTKEYRSAIKHQIDDLSIEHLEAYVKFDNSLIEEIGRKSTFIEIAKRLNIDTDLTPKLNDEMASDVDLSPGS